VVVEPHARFDLARLGARPDRAALAPLLDHRGLWVKLSGADRLAPRPPADDRLGPTGRPAAAQRPERVVWGTDFPHPNPTAQFTPDERRPGRPAVLDRAGQADRRRFCGQPETCFDFP